MKKMLPPSRLLCYLLVWCLGSCSELSGQAATDTLTWQQALTDGQPNLARRIVRQGSRAHFDRGENERGLALLHSYWQALAPIDSLRSEYIDLALDLSRTCSARLDWLDSSQYYQGQALATLAHHPDSMLLGKAYTYQGLYYKRLGYTKIAMEWFLRSLSVKAAIGYERGVGYSHYLIGWLYHEQRLYDKSLIHYQKAIQHAKLGGRERQMIYLQSLGELYADLGEESLALDYLHQALAAYRAQPQHQHFLPTIHKALGNTYHKFGHLEQALDHRRRVLNIVEKRRNRSYIIGALISLAQSQLALGQLGEARRYLDRAARLMEQFSLPRLRLRYYAIENDYHRARGDYRCAWTVQERYQLLQDSLYSTQTSAQILELEQLYENQKEEKRVATLEHQRQLGVEKLRRQRGRGRLLMGFSAILLLLLALISYLFYQIRIKNQSLLSALDERQLLIREIHHRVKNNLQLVSSMLFLQSVDLDRQREGRSRSLLREMQRRIKSMALVHQKLYHESAFGGVAAPAYVEDLLAHLLPALGLDPQGAQVAREVEDLWLDTDTTMAIGLLLNEWLTNALKHAEPREEGLRLHLSLRRREEQLELRFWDNGRVEANGQVAESTPGFGQHLIRALAEKLDARAERKGGAWQLLICRFRMR